MKRVCFLVNYNQYESKRYFTEKLAEALKEAGIESQIFDLVESKLHEHSIEKIKEFQPDATLSFNSFVPLPDGRYLWDLIKIPHLSMLLDPSLYSVNLINSPYSIISCVDHFDCQGLASQNFNRLFFFPHATEKELCEKEELAKEYDVVFIGSSYDYEALRTKWERELSKEEGEAILLATDLFLSKKEVSLQEALVTAWKQLNQAVQGVDFLKLFTYLDKYSRGLDRTELIRSIDDAEVHIFGDAFEDEVVVSKGWRELLQGKSNVIFHKSVPYEQSLEILRKSKICLNSSPFFKNGSHERLFNAPAAGALLITNETLFTDEHFNSQEIVTYKPLDYSNVNEKVDFYLNNEPERKKMVQAAKENVSKNHTWDHRADLLKNVLPKMIELTKPFIKL